MWKSVENISRVKINEKALIYKGFSKFINFGKLKFSTPSY